VASVFFEVDTTSSSNTNSYASGSFAVAVGDLIVVFVTATATVAAASMTDSLGEVTFTKITSALKASSGDTLYLFISNGFATSTSSRTVTFDCTGDNATGCIITAYSITGMSKAGSAAVRQSAIQSNQAAAGTPAPAFTNAALTGNPTLGMVGNAATAAPSMTEASGWTEGSDSAYSTPSTGQETIGRASGFTGTTITWGSTSATAFGDIIVELDASSFPAGEEDAVESKILKQTPFEPNVTVWQ
jgi:hypothetical protein